MRKICRFCKGAGEMVLPGYGSRICGNCKGTGQEPQTHFDEITESPEKLAEWLAKHYDYCTYADCDNCPVNNEDGSCENEGKTDFEIWLWWLKQEVKK